jgi:16S rRNA (guanine966-N2)-methyltransferase
MRVITGEAKGRKLKGPPDIRTRPMQDKIKEAVFSALESVDTVADRVLDLYAGTGGIGIEALSRGATHVDFVDRGQEACAVIRWNLDHTRLADRATVHRATVERYLAMHHQPYDLVVLDPPYADPDIPQTIERIARSSLVESGSTIVLGHWPKFVAPELPELRLVRRRCHGDSCFSIFVVDRDAIGGA